MKDAIQKLLSLAGMKVIRYPEADLRRRLLLIDNFRINKILDVGANAGFYAIEMRKLGFKGDIISFEPLKDAFEKLARASSKDARWQAQNIALGDADTESMINIAGNSYSSSLLDMMPAHLESAPESDYINKQAVQVRKLDSIFSQYYKPGDNILLKIDTQGFEKNVLEGAAQSLQKIKGIQLEMSVVELYQGEMLYHEMTGYLKERGFELYSLENGFWNKKTGQLLQVDGIFFRS